MPTVCDPETGQQFRDGVSRSLFRAASDQLYGKVGWLDTVQQAVYTYMVSGLEQLLHASFVFPNSTLCFDSN